MAEYEFLGKSAEESGVWDHTGLNLSNMDLLQKVRWTFEEDGKIVLEIDTDVAELLTSRQAATQPEPANPFDLTKRFST